MRVSSIRFDFSVAFVIYAAICSALYLAGVYGLQYDFGYSTDSGMLNRFLYIYQHKSAFHLFGNLLSLAVLVGVIRQTGIINADLTFVFGVIVSFLATFGSECVTPTCGGSAIVYFLLAYYIWCFYDDNFNFTIAVIVIANIIGFVFGHTNILVHAISALWGMFYAIIYLIWLGQKMK